MSDPTKVSRRLVAVFAADVEGYSRLMGADEVGTLKGLTERRAILDRLIGDHGGRIANTAGDSVLAEFGSAVDAVQCAVEAQTALAEANSNQAPDRRICFRIGIHIGDVMVRAGDLFGDGVNIAARLQSTAKPGGVCISGATYDQVRKVLTITFADLGALQVKNIKEPIRAYQVDAPNETLDATVVRAVETESPPPLPDKPSIAVLPFQNLSGDPEQEYFADGMVEEIITALSRFKWLFVIARNSSFTFKGKAVDIKEVGRRLGVRYVLEGSVRKASGPKWCRQVPRPRFQVEIVKRWSARRGVRTFDLVSTHCVLARSALPRSRLIGRIRLALRRSAMFRFALSAARDGYD
jgi:adenylate cyclase